MKEINEQDCIDSLKHSLKEIYNMALFDWDTMPEEGRKEFQKQVLKMVDEALNFGEQIARQFHDVYERLAPQFGYQTREDTKVFDPQSQNGRLMIAVCAEVIGKIERERDEALKQIESNHGALLMMGRMLYESREKAERYRLEANAMMAKLHELQTYSDRLADGLPTGMLPRDVENLREANAELADDLQKVQQDLNAATSRIAKFVNYWQSFCECECASESPMGSCMYCDLQQLQASNIKNCLNSQTDPVQ